MRKHKIISALVFFLFLASAISAFAQVQESEYWRQDDNSSYVWINVTSIEAGQTLTFNINNVTGIPENGSSVFPFFDDFNDGVQDNNTWTITKLGSGGVCEYTEVNGVMKLNKINGNSEILCAMDSAKNWGRGYSIQARNRVGNPHSGTETTGWGWSIAPVENNEVQTGGSFVHYNSNNGDMGIYHSTDGFNHIPSIAFGFSTIVDFSLFHNESQYFQNGELVYQNESPIITDLMGPHFYEYSPTSSNTQFVESDWVVVRKRVYTEPSVVVNSIEGSMTVYVTNNYNETLEGYQVRIPDTIGGNLSILENLPKWDVPSTQIELLTGIGYFEEIPYVIDLENVSVNITPALATIESNLHNTSVNLTFPAQSFAGIYIETLNVSDDDDSSSDLLIYTFNVTQPPLWKEVLGNETINLQATITYQLAINSTYAFDAYANDSRFELISDNVTNKVNITFSPADIPSGATYHTTFTISNNDGSHVFENTFIVSALTMFVNSAYNQSDYYAFEDITSSTTIEVGIGRGNADITGQYYVNGIAPNPSIEYMNVTNGTVLNFSLSNTGLSQYDNVSLVYEGIDMEGAGFSSGNYYLNTTIKANTQCADTIDNDGDVVSDLSDADCDNFFDDSEFGTVDGGVAGAVVQSSTFSFSRASPITLSDAKCNIQINPEKILMLDDRVMIITVENNEKLSYSPQVNLEGDAETLKRLTIKGELGTILRGDTKEISIQYSTNLLGIPIFPFVGSADLVLSHDRCLPITVPIELLVQGVTDNTQLSIAGSDLNLKLSNVTDSSDFSWFTRVLYSAGIEVKEAEFSANDYITNAVYEKTSWLQNWVFAILIVFIWALILIDKNIFKNELLNIFTVVALLLILSSVTYLITMVVIRAITGA